MKNEETIKVELTEEEAALIFTYRKVRPELRELAYTFFSIFAGKQYSHEELEEILSRIS